MYPGLVRTTIEIDDDLLAQAQDLAGTDTKRATVEHALRDFVRRNDRRGLVGLRGTGWEGDLEVLRRSRAWGGADAG